MSLSENVKRLMRNEYSDDSNGPFEVHIEKVEDVRSDLVSNSSEIKIGKSLALLLPNPWKCAYNLKALGTHKCSILFSDALTANWFVKELTNSGERIIKNTRWAAYIPDYRVTCRVVTKDIDSTESPEEILQYLNPPPGWKDVWPELLEARHILRKVSNPQNSNEFSYVHTNFTLLTFKGNLPPKAALYLGKMIRLAP